MKVNTLYASLVLITLSSAHLYSMEEKPIISASDAVKEVEHTTEPTETQRLLNILRITGPGALKFLAVLPIFKNYTVTEIGNLPIPQELKEHVLNIRHQLNEALHDQILLTGNVEAVRFLLDVGADPNYINANGVRLLTTAMIPAQNNKEMTKLLIEKGADINAQNESGSTALMIAAISGWDEIIQILLEAGADPKHTDAYGKTALDLAEIYNREKAAHILKQAMNPE